MCEAQWSGSAGVCCVVEPLLVSLGGSGQSWWTLEGWDGRFLQEASKSQGGALSCSRRGVAWRAVPVCGARKAELPGLLFAQQEAPGWGVWMLQRRVM